MTLLQALQNRNLVEGVDFSLTGEVLVALDKTRSVPHIIHHNYIPDVYDLETGEVITPSVAAYDENVMIHHNLIPAVYETQQVLITPAVVVDGVETEPAVYESQQVLISAEIAAYDEQAMVDEIYQVSLPSLSDLKQDCIAVEDLALLVEEYLSDKQNLRDSEDSINISEGRIARWGFQNISQPSVEELFSLISSSKSKNDQLQINKEAEEYLKSTDWYAIRSIDGVAIPEDIVAERIAARLRIIR